MVIEVEDGIFFGVVVLEIAKALGHTKQKPENML